MKSIIDVKNLSFRYKENQNYYDVKDITFHVKRGEWLSIVGHNGSGKSTTVRLIDGLLEAESGEIVIDGQRLTEENVWNIRRQIGMVFQNPDNQFVGATVEDDVAFGLENQGLSRQEMKKRVEEALALVGMLDFKKREPARLSGGQKQRVAIAGVVALRPAILILDEATSMLDPEGRRELIGTVKGIRKDYDMTVISITHDLEEVAMSDRVLVMKKGKSENAFEGLMSRQDYLVVQANDLAKAFGNLKAFEHKLLDYCFSYVTKESTATDTFTTNAKEVLKHFGLNASGKNYERVARGFKALNENTALYLPIVENGVKGILMTQLFRKIKFLANGEVEFIFSEDAAPYVFALRSQFFSFKLAELAQIKSKYAIILMKLWEANRFKNQRVTTIQGDLDDWQDWFLGEERRMPPAIFARNCLKVGAEELEKKLGVDVYLNVVKNGRKVIGYEMQITDNRQVPTAEIIKQAEERSRQTDIYDFLD
ncbi:Rep [Streptococcus pneumoniae]|nr:Rep [Streptococcus pneumoniae]